MSNTIIKARHAILGGIIGDALGATLEFMPKEKSKSIIAKYSNFSDGLIGLGPFNLAPGQPTDDTEMALAIMSVINKYGSYQQELVADAYYRWFLSNPPDIGTTTSTAVSQQTAEKMIIASEKYSKNSLSNGFLMRLFGLVALYYNRSSKELENAICEDVELTHSHPEAKPIAYIYGIMLLGAIRGKNADDIYSWGEENSNHSMLLNTIYSAVNTGKNFFHYDDSTYYLDNVDSINIGFVGYALWLLLLALRKYKSYKDAILEVVKCGGDTDTNACIVGAVMGALYPETVPKNWIRSILQCKSQRQKTYPISNPSVWMEWLPV